MTKRQQKLAAKMWVATFRNFVDICYDMESIGEEDVQAILQEVDKLSNNLLGRHPFILTLPRIVEYVSESK